MARTIRVEVLKDGRVHLEFFGFPGETCLEEEKNLRDLLKQMGLWAVPVVTRKKEEELVEKELGEVESSRRQVRVE